MSRCHLQRKIPRTGAGSKEAVPFQTREQWLQLGRTRSVPGVWLLMNIQEAESDPVVSYEGGCLFMKKIYSNHKHLQNSRSGINLSHT